LALCYRYSEWKKWENDTRESVKWLKGGTKLGDLEEVLVIWMGQVNAKNDSN
jgi:hypothetical protein